MYVKMQPVRRPLHGASVQHRDTRRPTALAIEHKNRYSGREHECTSATSSV